MSLIWTLSVSEPDLASLRAFREAARQVRDASVIANGDRIHIKGERESAPGPFKVTAELLASEPFRSLAVSVRLVYQSGEPANFGRVCNIIERLATSELRDRERKLRLKYDETLKRHNPFFVVVGLVRPDLYSPREMFETWLYYGVFHQNLSLKADYDAMAALGDAFPYTVQGIVLQLAGRILDLDDVIAEYLVEPQLPRLPSKAAALPSK